MRSLGWPDFVVGIGILLMAEGLLFAGLTAWMRKAMENALSASDQVLRGIGLASAVLGLILIWLIRH